MQENTNRAVVYNSIISYLRLIVTTICSLFITKYALKALGVTDFGLYAVVGSVVTFAGVINTVMLSTSNRFIAVAIGKGDEKEINAQFNVNLLIHIAIAGIILLIGLPIGEWYIYKFINYEGSIGDAIWVYRFSLFGAAVSAVSVPFNGLLMAKERFFVFSIVDVIMHLIKLGVVVGLFYISISYRLLTYSFAFALFTALPTFIYSFCCHRLFPSIVKPVFIKDKAKYKSVFSFSVWVSYGAVAVIGRSQGAALLINAFFNTIMNTALGIANNINSLISMVALNIANPIAPQVTKSYAAGNTERSYSLLKVSTKYTYLLMLIVSSPILVDCDYVLKLWLGEVPPYASLFAVLLIIDNLISSLNSGISNIIFANGKIKSYQLIVNTNRLLAIVAAYFALERGAPAYFLIITYIIFTIMNVFLVQIILHRTLNFNNKILVSGSYIPCILVTMLFLPIVLYRGIDVHPLLRIMVSALLLLGIVYFFGFGKSERVFLKSHIGRLIKKDNKNVKD